MSDDLRCGDCGVAIGEPHAAYCDVARCLWTGRQRIQCTGVGAEGRHDCGRQVWTGLWPGAAECREYGLYARLVPGQGWIPCSPDHPDAMEDLNTLFTKARWDRNSARWVLREEA